MNKENFIKELKEVADFLEEKDFDFEDCNIFDFTIFIACRSKESFQKNAKALGTFEKSADAWINATRKFDQISIQVTAERDLVCKKVLVGTKIIPATEEKIIPEMIVPACPEREEEVYEYKCPESFINMKEDSQENA